MAPLPASVRSKIIRYLLLHWRPDAIAAEVHCGVSTVYVIQENLFIYGSPSRPRLRQTGAPRKVSKAAEDDLICWLEEQPWAQQSEMVWYLWEEWGMQVHRSTISRILKRRGWKEKKGHGIGERQDEELRTRWIAELLDIVAEQMVYIDESMFNETTGWRYRSRAPVGQEGRYHASRQRGHGWSVLPAYTSEGYLPCTAIKEGWFNGDELYDWIVTQLLPHCNAFPAPRSVIITDQASIHDNPRIKEAIEAHGCQVRYLPPHSPDFNPTELTFSVLKVRHLQLVFDLFLTHLF